MYLFLVWFTLGVAGLRVGQLPSIWFTLLVFLSEKLSVLGRLAFASRFFVFVPLRSQQCNLFLFASSTELTAGIYANYPARIDIALTLISCRKPRISWDKNSPTCPASHTGVYPFRHIAAIPNAIHILINTLLLVVQNAYSFTHSLT